MTEFIEVASNSLKYSFFLTTFIYLALADKSKMMQYEANQQYKDLKLHVNLYNNISKNVLREWITKSTVQDRNFFKNELENKSCYVQ